MGGPQHCEWLCKARSTPERVFHFGPLTPLAGFFFSLRVKKGPLLELLTMRTRAGSAHR